MPSTLSLTKHNILSTNMVLFWRRNKKEKPNNAQKNKMTKNLKPITTTTTTTTDLEIPSHFLCPISFDLMWDPVTLSSGITYDRASIETWLNSAATVLACPVTNKPLVRHGPAETALLIPNHALRQMIQQWRTQRRCPVPPAAAAGAIASVEASAARLDARACARHAARVRRWASESGSDRGGDRRYVAARALARALDAFARADGGNHYNCDRETAEACGEILSALSWMFPLGDAAEECLSSEASLRCVAWFLRRNDDDNKRSSLAVLEELVSGSHGDDRRQILEVLSNTGVVEALMGLVRSQTCPKLTKSSLMLILHFFSSETNNYPCSEKVRSEFLEKGLVSLVLEILVDNSQKGNTVISERALGVMDGLCGTQKGREMALENDLTIPVLVKKLLRVSALATEFSVSAIWKLFRRTENKEDDDEFGELIRSAIVEALQVGAFQKLLVTIQLGCGDETKEKATELLKLLNPFRPQFECIESVDFKGLKRSF